jgi:hypothetical protein
MFNNKNSRKDESLQNPEVLKDNYGALLDKLAKSEPIFTDEMNDSNSNSNR